MQAPTEIIVGKNSNYIIPSEFEAFKYNLPRATLVKVEKAGHWVHAENPEAFHSELITFLEK